MSGYAFVGSNRPAEAKTFGPCGKNGGFYAACVRDLAGNELAIRNIAGRR